MIHAVETRSEDKFEYEPERPRASNTGRRPDESIPDGKMYVLLLVNQGGATLPKRSSLGEGLAGPGNDVLSGRLHGRMPEVILNRRD